jgi:hypothetical protein
LSLDIFSRTISDFHVSGVILLLGLTDTALLVAPALFTTMLWALAA